MADVVLTVSPDTASKDEVLTAFDQEIEKFSKYMAALESPGAGALNNPEKALLKTFLVFKHKETR